MEKPPISVLVVDDEENLLNTLARLLQLQDYYVNTAQDGREAINILQSLPFDVVLLDIMMPNIGGIEVLKFIKDQHLDTEAIMLTAVQDVKTAVECMKLGAYYYVTKPYMAEEVLGLVAMAVERKNLLFNNKVLRTQLQSKALSSRIITQNKLFLETLDIASRAAQSDATVLVEGPSGTGKELVANFIHNNSARKEQPMLALNCSSIPETLVESELFGHEKGAFTDATATKQGLVEMTNGGTLFLDEVAELPLVVQPKLLRFLQTGEFRRVGGNRNLKANVRIISATNADLRNETAAKRFREDLLFRLNVITLRLPSLHDRKDDIPMLIQHFLSMQAGNKKPKKMDENALEVLMRYDWPGNVRELENVVERASVLSPEEVIRVDDLALPVSAASTFGITSRLSEGEVRAGSAVTLSAMQKAHIQGVLQSVNWDKELAAKILGIKLRTLYSKMQALNLVSPSRG